MFMQLLHKAHSKLQMKRLLYVLLLSLLCEGDAGDKAKGDVDPRRGAWLQQCQRCKSTCSTSCAVYSYCIQD